MGIRMQHVALQEVPVHKGPLTKVVVPDLLPGKPDLAAQREIPVVVGAAEANIFERIHVVVTESWIGQEPPVFLVRRNVVVSRRCDVLLPGRFKLPESCIPGAECTKEHKE